MYETKLTFDSSKINGNKLSFDLNFTKVETMDDSSTLSKFNEDNRLKILLVEDNKVNQIITKKRKLGTLKND